MEKSLVQEFFLYVNKLEGKDYLLTKIAYGIAPTLKGIKPSSLMSFSISGKNMYRLWEKYKHDICKEMGVSFFELKESSDQRLVLFYNKEMMNKLLDSKKIRKFLKEMGYSKHMSLEQTLELLRTRFESTFPHEIGVFLGIPVEDVYGFIRHKAEKCLFCRYWKVYHNCEHAKSLFQCYDRAKTSIIHSIVNGKQKRKV
ncbi:MAG TPA: DUF3793 family protein [Desulfitobacteriaceae bacterium]|nr:DUF3793 family protein [Desulfitobacteriaceae bacterium]